MSDDEVNPGGKISLRRGKKKKDGTNWVMFAGGAIAMAVSVAFGRKKILEEGAEAKEAASETRTIQALHQEGLALLNIPAPGDVDDESGALQIFETVPHRTLQWENPEPVAPPTEADLEFRSFKTKRPAPTDPSPPVSKYIRQGSVTHQFSKDVDQSNTQISSALQSGVTARHSEVVQRLRQQIKSRDAIIYDMQTQFADQDQMIAMHRNHSVDLQDCVQAISSKLFEANLEIQRLQRELMTQRAKPIVGLGEEFIGYAVSEIKRQWVHRDVEEIMQEAKKLKEEVEHLRREKEAKERITQAKSRQCELLSKRLSTLNAELEEVKTAAHGKQRLLEAKEQEYLKLANVVQDLQRKLEIEARDKESQERSMKLSNRTDVRNVKSSRNFDGPITPTTCAEISATCTYYPAGNVRKSYGLVPVRNDKKESAANVEPRCLFGGYKEKRDGHADQDGRLEDVKNNLKLDESVILKFGHELDQLESALAMTSKVVSEKVQDVNRILLDFGKHIDARADAQSNRSTSAEQRQELRHELEQVAKQEDIKRDMKELTKHQAKLAELKSLMAKITARFNTPEIKNDASSREVLQEAVFVFELEQKLAAQDEIAKETSLMIQQLSTSLQLSSPFDPPLQETWRTVQETSTGPSSHNVHRRHSFLASSDENPRNARQQPQTLHEHKPSQILERQDFPSALRSFNQNRNKNTERQTSSPTKLLETPSHFQLGAFDPVPPISRTRPSASSNRQPNCEENQHSKRVSFRPASETTLGFSFGSRARDHSLNNARTNSGNYFSDSSEQGDRMSSPEPETHTHKFAAFNPSPEPSVTPTLTKMCRPNYSGSEFSVSPGFNSFVTSPAYDGFKHSPLAQFGSPRFGLSNDESSSRSSRSQLTSNSASTSGLDDSTTGLRKLNFFTSGREQDSRGDEVRIKRSIGGIISHSGRSNSDASSRQVDKNSATSSSIGVSPFAARMAQVDVGSLRNFVKGQVLQEDEGDQDREEDVIPWGVSNSMEERQLFNKDVESLCRGIVNLNALEGDQAVRESEDFSGSYNPDEPLALLPSLLRRSSESSNQRH